ncbi:MAG: hypothetical protein KatS3mg114_0231 [Planctomycetaceae bacterium]|nr:MAG: hypothetical protein KatS3mg114_0231 [Planctomycetaceae bacterium]
MAWLRVWLLVFQVGLFIIVWQGDHPRTARQHVVRGSMAKPQDTLSHIWSASLRLRQMSTQRMTLRGLCPITRMPAEPRRSRCVRRGVAAPIGKGSDTWVVATVAMPQNGFPVVQKGRAVEELLDRLLQRRRASPACVLLPSVVEPWPMR